MTLPEIKKINIREYLNNMGIHPAKEYGYYGLYHCPYREDRNASFKVDYTKNVWYDFGTNEGGSIIDLVMKINNCSFHEAATKLEKDYTGLDSDSFSFHRDNISKETRNNPVTTIQNIIPITHPRLIEWVQERKIDLELANKYCREIHYRNKEKDYFSIGFRNDRGGYELSSPPDFKGCISQKDITTIRRNSDTCLVFEGFWDLLSYLTLQKVDKSKHDIAVLNSVANVQKSMNFLKTHREIYTYLDNDDAGRKATELIKSNCVSVNNRSERHAGFKDLNDYLRGKKQVQAKVKKKGIRL
jgi:DNA primase